MLEVVLSIGVKSTPDWSNLHMYLVLLSYLLTLFLIYFSQEDLKPLHSTLLLDTQVVYT